MLEQNMIDCPHTIYLLSSKTSSWGMEQQTAMLLVFQNQQ